MSMREFRDWATYLSELNGAPKEIELPHDQLVETIKAALEAG